MLNPSAAARRAIPSLDRLLQLGAVADLIARYGRPLVAEAARAHLAALRSTPDTSQPAFDEAAFVRACTARLAGAARPAL
jgi:hypothetical protein